MTAFESSRQTKTGKMPTGLEMIADLRRRLDGFWNHPEVSRRIDAKGGATDLATAVTLQELAQAHFQKLPTGLEAHPGSTLRLIGAWTTRNGELTQIEGDGRALPEDDRLLVVTLATTVTTAEALICDTHVMLFERVG